MNFNSIQDFNAYLKAVAPKHNFIDVGTYHNDILRSSSAVYPNFYRISLKYGLEKEKNRGFMYFSSPDQAIEWHTDTPWQGYYINITKDLISSNQHLNYSFLNYGLHEPLFLTIEEESLIAKLFIEMLNEYKKNIFSMDLLLAYCNLIFAHIGRFYGRQFGERKLQNTQLVSAFFKLLENYYTLSKDEETLQPTVSYFAEQLNVTPNYLSDVLKFQTGKPALEQIHLHIIKEAKTLLLREHCAISDIAYRLGFDYPSYFTRLFRKQTGLTPTRFRNQ